MPAHASRTIIRAALFLALLALPSAGSASPRGGERLGPEEHHIREGWNLLSEGRYSLALAKFALVDAAKHPLGDYVIHFRGLALARSDDPVGAAEAVASLERWPGGSPLLPRLALEAAFRRAAAGDLEGARTLFAKARGRTGANGSAAAEGYLSARLLDASDPVGAAEGYLATFSANPSREGGRLSMERLLESWRGGYFARWRLPRRFLVSFARSLVRSGEERVGRLVYREALRRFPLDNEAWPVVLEFAETLRKGGDLKGARALLHLLDGAPRPVRGEAEFLRARVEWRAGRLPEARSVFLSIAADNVGRDTAEKAAYQAAWIAEEEGDLTTASEAFAALSGASDPVIRGEARFRGAWLLLLLGRAGDAEAALSAGEAEGDRISPAEGARYRYWRARALREAGRGEEADLLFRRVAADPAAGPYALVARIPLGRHPYELFTVPPEKVGGTWETERERLWERLSSAPWDAGNAAVVERASLLASMGMAEYAAIEAERVDRSVLKKVAGTGAGGAALFRYLAGDLKGAMAELDRNGISDEALADRIRYPLAPGWIGPPDRPRAGVDPLLVHALTRQESRFQPDILSPAGAVGLMQLLPKTARETASRAGRRKPDRWELLNPEVNVELGSRYLARLVRRYGGEYLHALAAYNGGERATDRWVERSGGDGGMFLETISYRETRLYVRRVVFNLLQYYRIYRPGTLARIDPTPVPAAPRGPGGSGTPPTAAEGGETTGEGSGTPAP